MNRDILFTPVDGSRDDQRVLFEITQLLSLGLFLAFVGTGVAKIASTDFVLATFPGWTAPAWTLMAIGLFEVAAAVLTLLPTTRLLGAGLLASLMAGALAYHAALAELLQLAIPASAALVALAVLRMELALRQAELEPAPATARSR